MMQRTRAGLGLVLLGYAAVGGSYPWDQDMVDQPSHKPQESQAPPEPNAIPIEGGETLPAPTTEAEQFAGKDEAVSIINPVPATPESLARGQVLYEMTCQVCHGVDGRGEGPVGKLFEPSPVDLNDAYTQDQADGQLFYTLTRGRVAMPYYRDVLSHQERWDVVNYVKHTFGEP